MKGRSLKLLKEFSREKEDEVTNKELLFTAVMVNVHASSSQ